MKSWEATLLVYAATIFAAGISSLFFDWIFVFVVSLAICAVTGLMFLVQGGSWWTLAQVWSTIAVFHVAYFCIGLVGFYLRLKLAETRTPRETRRKEPQR